MRRVPRAGIRERPPRRYPLVSSGFLPLHLVVKPAAAVAHAAAHLPAELPARLRFRTHGDPCCFYVDVCEVGDDWPRYTFVFIAWPDGGGSRLELHAAGKPLAGSVPTLAALVTFLVMLPLARISVLVPVLATVIAAALGRAATRSVADTPDALSAVARAFEPLRRNVGPFREPATGA